ncbi:unnamed protein product [Protopolystoma xenopodis]|uniref:Uncharacterized protein n=1 Tax=Protopolystoma xenopodis TaxID=117903 RepID=A0A448X7T8_9PLAT|nr:unnamed protein product [Protopolystoma xenopodis]
MWHSNSDIRLDSDDEENISNSASCSEGSEDLSDIVSSCTSRPMPSGKVRRPPPMLVDLAGGADEASLDILAEVRLEGCELRPQDVEDITTGDLEENEDDVAWATRLARAERVASDQAMTQKSIGT